MDDYLKNKIWMCLNIKWELANKLDLVFYINANNEKLILGEIMATNEEVVVSYKHTFPLKNSNHLPYRNYSELFNVSDWRMTPYRIHKSQIWNPKNQKLKEIVEVI